MRTSSNTPYRQQLESLKTELLSRTSALAKDIEHRTEPLEQDFAEQAVQRENEDVLNALGAEAQAELVLINSALKRIDKGEYGLCLRCGSEIPPARLAALPYAEYCVTCAEADN